MISPKKGPIVPKMGLNILGLKAMQSAILGEALFTKSQQKVLGLLYGRPDETFYLNEIVRFADIGKGTIKRELERMQASGLLTMRRIGNQNHYQANKDCPIYDEILSIVRKTFGLVDIIRSALAPLDEIIELAFIFGSVASGKETATSDIDLMIIGDVGFTEVVSALYSIQETLGREINPKIYSRGEWTQIKNKKDAFIKEILEKPRMDVIGDANELG